ncbi:general alpha-glucoside permease [Apiospora arundinis]
MTELNTTQLLFQNQFQIHGNKIRLEPNTVLFRDPDAYAEIYGMKSNVRRSDFYTAWQRNDKDQTTLDTVDVKEHTRKHRLLNISSTEKSVRAVSTFVIRHVDRWHQLLVEGNGTEWSAPIDFFELLDTLSFDIMGGLSFGKSFDVKERGKNSFKSIPYNIMQYLRFYYPIARSPFLKLLILLKPRGFNKLLDLMTPPEVQHYYQFVYNSVTERIRLHSQQMEKPEEEQRQDIFHFLCEARDPETGTQAYDETSLRAEANLLIIAGSDTTAVSLSGIFWYLIHDSLRCQKLVDELMATFESANDIFYGSKLSSCVYLRACIDEGMRLTHSGPCELSQEVLRGGLKVSGEYLPGGTIVGTVPWVVSRNEEVYGHVNVFRPEHWIANEAAGVTKEQVSRVRSNFHPFSA